MKTAFFLAVLVLVVGCSQKTSVELERVYWAREAAADCAEGARSPLSTDQLLAMIGRQPELKLRLADLPAALARRAQVTQQSIDGTMDKMAQGYFWRSAKSDGQPWKEAKELAGCEVWLYGWSNPTPVYVSGIVTRRTAIRRATYFLVRESVVVDAGQIAWDAAELRHDGRP